MEWSAASCRPHCWVVVVFGSCFVGSSLVRSRGEGVEAEDPMSLFRKDFDPENPMSLLRECFDLEEDFSADFERIAHRLWSNRENHRHRAHEARNTAVPDFQLAFPDTLDNALPDIRRFTRPVGCAVFGVGSRSLLVFVVLRRRGCSESFGGV